MQGVVTLTKWEARFIACALIVLALIIVDLAAQLRTSEHRRWWLELEHQYETVINTPHEKTPPA